MDVLSIDRILVYRTLVYSMKLGCWRMIKDCPYKSLCFRKGVYLNGALHWRSKNKIIVLDLGTEDYSQLLLPPIPARNELHEMHLGVLGGCLVLSYYHVGTRRYDGWVMNDYGVEKSWTRLFSFEKRDDGDARPIAYIKSKRHVLTSYAASTRILLG